MNRAKGTSPSGCRVTCCKVLGTDTRCPNLGARHDGGTPTAGWFHGKFRLWMRTGGTPMLNEISTSGSVVTSLNLGFTLKKMFHMFLVIVGISSRSKVFTKHWSIALGKMLWQGILTPNVHEIVRLQLLSMCELVGGWATSLKTMTSSVGMMSMEQIQIDVPNHQPDSWYISSEEVLLGNFRVTDDCQWLAVSPSWQPHPHLNHHVNHIIMSIASSWTSWEVWAIGNEWIHGWKHSRAQNPVSLRKVAVGGRRWRVSVSTVSRLDPESGRQNVRATVARARFLIKIVKITVRFRPLFEDEVDKMCTKL